MRHHYFVVSPEMSEVIPVTDYGQGPTEYFSCVATVEADNKRDAKVLALKTDEMRDWILQARGDGQPPLAGLEVLEAQCPHGVCVCDGCKGECSDCLFDDEQKEGMTEVLDASTSG
jgi:hypothetical protein